MKIKRDRVRRIYQKLKGARGLDEHELWQHALFFAKSPEERCRISLQTARSALSSRRFARKRLIEYKHSLLGRIEGQPVRILPLSRVIASKRASNRDKDRIALPILERTLRLAARLKRKSPSGSES